MLTHDKSNYTWRLGIVFGLAVLSVVGIFSLSPIAQDLHYHNFADSRTFLGIPNLLDVSSNLPFFIVGLMGLWFLRMRWSQMEFFIQPSERYLWLAVFAGIALVCFGSGYYHWNPNNATLVWDRIPITVGFMAVFAYVIAERINYRTGIILFPVLLVAGIGSVVYWNYSELKGMGDLRPYALVQLFPILAMPLIWVLFPARFSGVRFLVHMLVWYALAKLFEHFDKIVFELLQQTVSGHTIKHLLSGMAVYSLFKYFKHRQKKTAEPR